MESAAPVLQVDSVAKRYDGVRALDGVSFEVAQASITALIGPNGAGKTTLLNVVSGVVPLDQGHVTFKGVNVTRWPSYHICKLGFGRTFQAIQLFPALNALENVLAARCCRTRSTFLDSFIYWGRARREGRQNLEIALHALDAVKTDPDSGVEVLSGGVVFPSHDFDLSLSIPSVGIDFIVGGTIANERFNRHLKVNLYHLLSALTL